MADFLETLYYLCTLLSKYATSFRMVKKSIKVILTGITIVIYLSCASKKALPLTEIDNDFREEMLDTLYAVSYTHLDVYKRQVENMM